MADNTQLPIPSTSGDVIATDDITGVKFQRIKVTLGADGVNDGDVSSANPLPVSVASLPLPTDAATESTLSTMAANIADIETLLNGTGRLNNTPLTEYTGAFTALNQEITIDGTNIRSLSVQAYGTFSAVAVVEARNNASAPWDAVSGITEAGLVVNLNNQLRLKYQTGGAKFIRIRCSSYTSGTMNIVAEGYQETSSQNGVSPVALTTTTLSIGAVQRAISATTNGVSTFHHLISAASTNATSVKGSAGTITSIILSNTNAAARFFKLYNKASAPTVGTDTPIMTVMIPAGQTIDIEPPVETRLTSGIAYALTTGIAVADTGAVGLSDIAVHISYV